VFFIPVLQENPILLLQRAFLKQNKALCHHAHNVNP